MGMKNTLITIPGDVPSKKNSKQIIYRGGRSFIISSNKFLSWHKMTLQHLQAHYRGLKVENLDSITMIIFPSSKRKSDLSNKFESIADLLVDAGVIEDDNWFIMPKVHLIFGGVDKLNPRVGIELKTL